MEQGWDPDIKKYFKKILYCISYGSSWMLMVVAVGLYLGFAYPGKRPVTTVIIFYAVAFTTFVIMVRYFYKAWKK